VFVTADGASPAYVQEFIDARGQLAGACCEAEMPVGIYLEPTVRQQPVHDARIRERDERVVVAGQDAMALP
jgi:hypothetical protein